MATYYNPYTGGYDWEQDLKDHPECKAKILAIVKKLNLQTMMSHEQIRKLCGIWGCATPEETWRKINELSEDKLREDVERAMGIQKKRKLALQRYLESQHIVYTGEGIA